MGDEPSSTTIEIIYLTRSLKFLINVQVSPIMGASKSARARDVLAVCDMGATGLCCVQCILEYSLLWDINLD